MQKESNNNEKCNNREEQCNKKTSTESTCSRSITKLHPWASKSIHRIVMIARILTSTEPTPLIMTDWTSHVITPFTLFSLRLTRRTFMNSMFLNISFEIPINHVFTRPPLMPWIRTLETKLMSAFTNNSIRGCHLNPFSTVRSWTPFLTAVKINLNV